MWESSKRSRTSDVESTRTKPSVAASEVGVESAFGSGAGAGAGDEERLEISCSRCPSDVVMGCNASRVKAIILLKMTATKCRCFFGQAGWLVPKPMCKWSWLQGGHALVQALDKFLMASTTRSNSSGGEVTGSSARSGGIDAEAAELDRMVP